MGQLLFLQNMSEDLMKSTIFGYDNTGFISHWVYCLKGEEMSI